MTVLLVMTLFDKDGVPIQGSYTKKSYTGLEAHPVYWSASEWLGGLLRAREEHC